MKSLQSTGQIITRNILIVVFIIAFILVSLNRLFYLSEQKAYRNSSVPKICGIKYVRVSNYNLVNDEVSYGGFVVLKDYDTTSEVGKGSIIVFETTSFSSDNEVFGSYSMGLIKSVEEKYEDTIYNVASGDETIAVSSAIVDSYAVRSIGGLGSVISYILSVHGYVFLIIIPCCLFVLSLLLYMFFLISDLIGYKKYKKELKNQDYEYMEDMENTDDTMDIIDFQNQIYSSVTYDQEDDFVSLPEIKSETVSTLDIGYMNLDTQPVGDGIKQTKSDESKSDNPKKELDNNAREIDLNELKQKIVGDSNKPSDKGIKTGRISESINLNIKDDTLEFEFEKMQSDKISVELDADRGGFVIKTPNYEARINVDIKNK